LASKCEALSSNPDTAKKVFKCRGKDFEGFYPIEMINV
jgi:hypothetical protein